MLAPQDREYKRILESRRPYYSDLSSKTTRNLFSNVLRLLFANERKIDVLRIKLSKSISFRIQNTFERIDRLGKGYIVDSDIVTFLQISDIAFINKDVDLLMARWDKNRDGIISYSEFSHDLYPA